MAFFLFVFVLFLFNCIAVVISQEFASWLIGYVILRLLFLKTFKGVLPTDKIL